MKIKNRSKAENIDWLMFWINSETAKPSESNEADFNGAELREMVGLIASSDDQEVANAVRAH